MRGARCLLQCDIPVRREEMAAYKIVLIRHGESTWNQENRFCGWFDADLSDTGMEEAKRGGQALRGYQFDICYTSVLKRAIRNPMAGDGRHRPDVDAGHQDLEAEREALRRADRPEQGRRRAAKHGEEGSPLQRPDRRPAPELRKPEGHHCQSPAILERRDRSEDQRREEGPHCRPWQQP
ncbi:unnamed protein product [Staurois parvus]|uniref:Phosphoglycerate mutase n=1 Tax=Staurois parvus TaxID=386267 RepID=A0ABN9AGH1_9NEOB|nr:unnamed protein product [Staurois parvus]